MHNLNKSFEPLKKSIMEQFKCQVLFKAPSRVQLWNGRINSIMWLHARKDITYCKFRVTTTKPYLYVCVGPTFPLKPVVTVSHRLSSALTFSSILTFLENIWMKVVKKIHYRVRYSRLTAFIGALWVLRAQSTPRKAVDSVLSWPCVNFY